MKVITVVLDLIGELYRYFREERERHVREEGVYWVIDLVSCSQKERFSRIYPELELAQLFNPILIQGALVHAGLEEILKEVLGKKGARVEVEPEGSLELDLREFIPSAEGKVSIKGRVDLLVELSSGKRVGIEIKTARADLSIPHEHHVDQVKIYNTMFDMDESYIIYVTPDRITQYRVEEKMSMADIAGRVAVPKVPRYSWECLTPDTLIWTFDCGLKPVGDVSVGDVVMSYSMNGVVAGRVTHVFRRYVDEEIYVLKPYYFPPLRITGNHPVLARRGAEHSLWIEVRELEEVWSDEGGEHEGMYLVFPIYAKEVDVPELNANLCELIGYYAARGCSDNSNLVFSIRPDEDEVAGRIGEIVRDEFGASLQEYTRVVNCRKHRYLCIHSTEALRVIRNYVWSDGVGIRMLSPKLLLLPKFKQQIFLNAFMSEDKCAIKTKNKRVIGCTTSSKMLALQVQFILLRLGKIASVITQLVDRFGESVVYRVYYYEGDPTHSLIERDSFWAPIQYIKRERYRGPVYNLEVERWENYVTMSGVVHNCQYCSFSVLCPYKVVK